MPKDLQPVNPLERRTANHINEIAQQGITLAIAELRKADEVHVLRRQLLTILQQEMMDYPEGSEANTSMQSALADLHRAERVVRARGETNGR